MSTFSMHLRGESDNVITQRGEMTEAKSRDLILANANSKNYI